MSGLSIEQESILGNILTDYDQFMVTSFSGEPTRILGELAISDQRIQSLIREKDTEIMKLRDRLFSL